MAHDKTIQALVVDFDQSYPLLRSIAAAYTISQSMSQIWRPSDVYYIPLPGATGSPGTWEATIPNPQVLKTAIDHQTLERVNHFIRASFQGSVALQRHLEDKIKIRDKCLDNIKTRMAEFNQINANTLSGLDSSIKLLKAGRFVNNIALITSGAVGAALLKGGATWTAAEAAAWVGGGGVGVAGVPLLKSLGVGLAKNWEASRNTGATMVAFETGKVATSSTMDYGSDKLIEKQFKVKGDGGNKVEATRAAMQQVRQELKRKKDRRIGGQSTKGKAARQRKIAAKSAEVRKAEAAHKAASAEASAAARKTRWVSGFGKVVKTTASTLFVCWDLYDAFVELGE
ncbi:hypothetical protein [Novipirellula aureliae]|uniref:hypothetical protein n=1 Tax=Novipirellula aureliae TaxID=2527966 RepID=UPI0011B586C9|nr:hypothetical protein [Novipirellula aureliae]